MNFHRALLIISAANIVCCFTAFYFLDKYEPDNAMTATYLGWIFWIGLYAIIAPLFLSDDTRALIFSRKYLVGTLVLSMVNFAAIIGCVLWAAALAK